MSDSLNPYASPQVDASAPGAEWAAHDSGELRRVGLGVGLVYAGLCMIVGGIIVAVVGGMGAGMMGNGVLGVVAIALGILLFLVGYILNVVGPFFCLAVPEQSGARGLIIGSVVFMVLGIVLAIVVQSSIHAWNFRANVNVGIGGNLSSIPSLTGVLLFLLFLRKLAIFIGRPDLARRALTVLISALVVGGLFFGLATGGGRMAGNLAGFENVLGIVFLALAIGGLIVFVTYVNLLDTMRKALRP